MPTVGWTLNWGIHNGTLTSRDKGDPKKGLESLEACREEAIRLNRAFGTYRLWYATAVSPEGEETHFPELAHPYI